MQEYEFSINGVPDREYQPKDLQDLNIIATFDNSSIQPNITTTEIELLSKARKDILNYIAGGLTGSTSGIFEGLPYEIKLKRGTATYNALKCLIDFTDDFKINDTSINCKLLSNDGLNDITNKAQALTFGYLEDQKKITQSDYVAVPYVINYIPDYIQLALLSISVYMLTKELKETMPKLAEHTQAVITAATPSVGFPSINIGNVIIQALKLALLIAWIGLMIAAIAKMINQIINSLYSDVRYHKGMRIKRMIDICCEHLNLTLSSTLFSGVFKDLLFLPAKTEKGQAGKIGKQKGIPTSASYGYTFYEILQLVMKLFNAKLLVKDNILYIESLQNTAFWERNSTYILPDIEKLTYQYNTNELQGTLLLRFDTDISDLNTIDNFSGTNYERLTIPISRANQENVLIKNLQEISFLVARGTRKDDLTLIEETLKTMLAIADILTVNAFHFSSKFKQSRVGALNLTSDNFSTAKLILIDSADKVSNNNDTYIRAKYFYDNYYKITSFVENNFNNNQYKVYKDITIPFGFTDFLAVIMNSYCKTKQGETAKIDKLVWNFTEDFAVIDYRIKEVYTKNLREIFIEP